MTPERIVKLQLRYSVKWVYSDSGKRSSSGLEFKDRAIGFSLQNTKDELIQTFYGTSLVMNPIREFLA